MAAALPSIRKSVTPQSERSGIILQESFPSPPKTGSVRSRAGTSLTSKSFKLKNANRKEQEILLNRDQLRAEQPVLSKAETAAYRNTFKHNLCLDMLQLGYHRAFSELHMLMKKQADARIAAGPDSILWNIPLLETEQDKLDSLRFYLTEAEEALREGNLKLVYKNRFTLAQYFQGRGDKWLSDHFFLTCLDVSSQEKESEERLCEALCHVGLAQEENGELFDAVDKFEDYHKNSIDKSEWRTESGQLFHKDACDHLTRIYTKISESLEPEQKAAKVEYLTKAYEAAKEGDDDKITGEAAYKLGNAYTRMGDPKTGIMHLKMHLEICETKQDDIGIGKACDALAKAYDSEGKVDESVKYLVRFVEVAERSKQDVALAQACSSLGYICNCKGNHAEASKYFSRAFTLSQSKNNRAGTESAAVHLGVANALGMMRGVKGQMDNPGKHELLTLIAWKNQRQEKFGNTINTSSNPGAAEAHSSTVEESPKAQSPAQES